MEKHGSRLARRRQGSVDCGRCGAGVVSIVVGSALLGVLLVNAWAATTGPAADEGSAPEVPKIVTVLEGYDLGPRAVVVAIATLPIFELRGSIPVAIWYYKMPWWESYLLSFIGNLLPIIPIILLIGPVSNFLMKRSKLWRRFFTWVFERSRRRGGDLVEKYEALGLAIFVAIPLPVTGAWTGAMVASVFHMNFWRALLCMVLGVMIASAVVTALSLAGFYTYHAATG